eukprot:CAMPEP_0194281212 /NCGR_PEP_ID=MMETSP0169-20130528/20234_1 /TAXON_ID=218684 /ORGANISM="Corethron pennatum, Strain L29A3" /LENGTH=407 /DNA_ID=CAMNT_0039026205 /DNA_START=66 /DNA_END=1289 /DNA_ORIENTATION=+
MTEGRRRVVDIHLQDFPMKGMEIRQVRIEGPCGARSGGPSDENDLEAASRQLLWDRSLAQFLSRDGGTRRARFFLRHIWMIIGTVVILEFFLTIWGVASVGSVSAFSPVRPHRFLVSTKSIATFTILNAAKKKKKSPTPSSDLLNSFGVMFGKNNKSSMESGIETALLLIDEKRQKQWKADMEKEFPFIPATALDICLDCLTDAFSSIAPSQLKSALRPGGLEKIRPELEETIVDAMEKYYMIKNIPLKPSAKTELLQYLVNLGLDYALKDVEKALADPVERLQALGLQKRQITRYMTRKQLLWFRIRYRPLQTAAILSGTALVSFSCYRECRRTVLLSNISDVGAAFLFSIGGMATELAALFASEREKSHILKKVHQIVSSSVRGFVAKLAILFSTMTETSNIFKK